MYSTMKKTLTAIFACLLIGLLFGLTAVNADDAIKQQILKRFPQADRDNDGVISDAEEAFVSKQILKAVSSSGP